MSKIQAVERLAENSRSAKRQSGATSGTEPLEITGNVGQSEGNDAEGQRRVPMGKGVLIPVCGSCRIRVRAIAGEWKKEGPAYSG
jgi:hypothetical protein